MGTVTAVMLYGKHASHTLGNGILGKHITLSETRECFGSVVSSSQSMLCSTASQYVIHNYLL
jgi:hypothetical protein